MQLLSTLRNRIPSLALLMSMLTAVLLTSCGSGRRADGSLTIIGIAYLLITVFAFLSLIM